MLSLLFSQPQIHYVLASCGSQQSYGYMLRLFTELIHQNKNLTESKPSQNCEHLYVKQIWHSTGLRNVVP